MKIILFLCCLFLQLLLAPALFAQTVTTSDLKDRTRLQVSVYNSNLGMITETRKLVLPPGEGELRFMEVAPHILPATVHASSLKRPTDFSLLEQSYEFDLMNAKRLLDKYVGRQIKIVNWNEAQDRREQVEATLLSNNEDQIFEIGGEIYLGHPGYRVLPRLPEDLVTNPTLSWKYANRIREPIELEVSYLTTDMNWSADYLMLVDSKETSSQLSGWATIENRSGTAFKDAELRLIAGDVHRVAKERENVLQASDMRVAKAAAPQFEEGSLFEYHTYDLRRRTTLKDNQSKQIRFLDAGSVRTSKEYLVYGTRFGPARISMDEPLRQLVSVFMLFKNAKEDGLGLPLPAGIVRLYREDEKGESRFIGEDRIRHVPVDEEVRLKVGETGEVTSERVQSDFRQTTSKLYESEWEITLRNHKDKEVSVGLIEPLPGNWKMVSNSHPFKKTGAFTVRFDIKIPPDSEVKVKYRVQVGI